MMGDKEMMIDESSNIHVDGVEYKETPGLWMLIMSSRPKDYTSQTNVRSHPRGVKRGISRPTTTYKWRYILQEHHNGKGTVQFLPGYIKRLTTKLKLLLAEFAAGNTSSTRNEIVYILDELLRRKQISREEYRDINSYLSKCL